MSGLDGVLSEFVSDLRRTRELLGLVENFREFGSSSPPDEILDETIVWKEAMVLKESAPQLRTDLPLMSGSMLLYICGRFEFFVRQIIEALADDIVSTVEVYEQLPKSLRDELRRRTLELVSAPKKFNLEGAEADAMLIGLASNLDSVNREVGSVVIESRVLSITEANMRPEVLNDLMKRVGVKDVWQELGKQAKLKSFLHKPTDGECTNAARSRLTDLMNMRNQIAHPTIDTSFPAPDQVVWVTEYLETLGSVLVEVCNVYLSTFYSDTTSVGVDPFS